MWFLGVFFLGCARGDYATNPFLVGSLEGPSVSFVLDFGDLRRPYNSFPLMSIRNDTDKFYEFLYATGMTSLEPVYFQIDTTGVEVGVLSLWNASFSYCYRNYQANNDGKIHLGMQCLDKNVYGSQTRVETNFVDKAAFAARLEEVVYQTEEKVAIEFDPARPFEFKVYYDLPDVDNISTITIPVILVIFFMAWLGWTHDISLIAQRTTQESIEASRQVWQRLCDDYVVIIADMISLCVSAAVISVFNGFALLRGGDVIQLVGIDSARLILFMWVGLISVFAVNIFMVMAFGYIDSETFKNKQDIKPWPTWKGFALVIGSLIVGVLTYFVFYDLEGIDRSWSILSGVVVSFVFAAWMSSHFFLRAITNDDGVQLLRSLIVGNNKDRRHQVLLTYRILTEFVVLTTLHATLPTTLDDVVSTTYRNAVGFLMGVVISVICGRDFTWILLHDMTSKGMGPLQTVWRISSVLVYLLGIMVYSSVFLAGPVFITATKLELEPTTALLISVSFVVQATCAGSIFAIVRFGDIAKEKTK